MSRFHYVKAALALAVVFLYPAAVSTLAQTARMVAPPEPETNPPEKR